MIGSPDVLVFSGGEGFGEEPTSHRYTPALPNELSIPLKPLSNPWTTTAQFNRDFILVAEFSEQVGPQPVMTVPEDPLVLGSFDLNHFSVRIMSVDYQAAFPAPATTTTTTTTTSTSPGGPRLNFTEDSRVVMGDSANGAFAYVQHITLYDLEARGFVRPFCMAYVSSDQRKLMEHFGELSARFTQASDSLKTGNRRAFATELQRKLQELEYTRLIVQQGAELQSAASEPPHVGEADEGLEALEHTILSYRDLLHQVMAYPNRKLKKSGFLPYDLADPSEPGSPVGPHPSPLSPAARLERRLKTLEELSGAYFVSVTVEQLADTERRLRGDRTALQGARLTRDLSRKLPLTNFLFELWNPEEGGDELEEQQQQQEAEEEKEPQSLESFLSCVEELPFKLEEEPEGSRAGVLSRGPEEWGVAEMTGSVSSGDSIEVLGTERSYRSQCPVTGDDHRETTLGKTDPWLRHAPPPEAACSRRVRAYAVRGNSEDSIEVLSTTDSIVPEDLQAITEEGSENQDTLPGGPDTRLAQAEGVAEGAQRFRDFLEQVAILRDERKEQRGNVGDKGKYPSLRVERDSVNRGQPSGCTSVSDGGQGETGEGGSTGRDTAHRDAVLEETTAMHQVEGNSVVLPSKSTSGLRGESLTMASDLPAMGRWSPPSTPFMMPSVDEVSESTGSSTSPSQSDGLSGNPRLDKRWRRKAALRALRFIQQNSFSQHAVFCLLSGRPLIVIGGDASRVTKLVSALALFLPAPGPDGATVLPFIDKPLQLTDLITWRLIGLHRTSSATSLAVLHSLARYRRYLALLDLDQRTLRCPAYSGSLIGRIANRHSNISRGSTYLLHLESCLTALANQVLVYTFPPLHRRDGDDIVRRDAMLLERGFCSSEDDLRVMRFLSDLIKQYHGGRGPPILGVSYRQTQIHKHIAGP